MCKEIENQFDFDEEMKQAEELFEKLKTFDFVEDTIEIEGNPETTKELQKKYREQNSIYKKWMLYKASEALTGKISEDYKEIRKYLDEGKYDEDKEIIKELYDPDGEIKKEKILGGSQLLQDIYKKLWPELTAREFMKYLLNDDQNTWICSDTMTSAQQRMNDFLQFIADSDFENVRTGSGPKQQYSLRLCIELYLKDKNEFKKKLKSMENFLNHWHMLGNYCPVPRHFNKARSGCTHYDYWDLTLMKIKEYYDEIENPDDKGDDAWKILGEELLHGTGNALACKKWLDYFGSWKNFIDKNYMQDFVNGNYEVEPFFEEHSWNKPTPEREEVFNDLFQNASKMIEKRTGRIVDALIAEYKQEQCLNGIMTKLKAIGAN